MAETAAADRRAAFIGAGTWHGSLEAAAAMLAAHPQLAGSDLHVDAILGDDAAVRAHLARDPASVHARRAPYGGNALTHLCLSRYLRLDPNRSAAFVRTATALLDAGADPNAGFWTTGERPEHETPLYGAAGVAHHAALTRLLIERGADPNDEEVAYHAPESNDLSAMAAVVETGRLTSQTLALMLLRKHDWHDFEGVRFLLEHGAGANTPWDRIRWRPLRHALARGNRLGIIDLLLDHGADPTLVDERDGLTAIAATIREGRSDVLTSFARRGIAVPAQGVDAAIAACAVDDAGAVRAAREHSTVVAGVIAMGGDLLAKFAGNGNRAGVARLLDLGVDVATPFAEGDGYFDEPKGSLAIHVAAWRGHPEIVTLLLERGSPVDVPDPKGRTPLALAIKACVDSYWAQRRTPETVAALLDAGASVHGPGVRFPSGYDAVDDLLRRHRA